MGAGIGRMSWSLVVSVLLMAGVGTVAPVFEEEQGFRALLS